MTDSGILNQSLERQYDVTRRDITKDKLLLHGAWASPLLLSVVPAIVLSILAVVFGSAPPLVATFLFFAFISLIVGFFIGLITSGILLAYRQKWLKSIRERIAVDGIKAEEVYWFKHELTTPERKALKEMESTDALIADAYKETLASRLTATRIVKSTKYELALVKRRQAKLKLIKSGVSEEILKQLHDDRKKLEEIDSEAKQMKNEAEARLQMIEAAVRRGTSFADNELTLKKLSARSQELPLALEALKMEDEIRKELMADDELATKELESAG